MKARSPEIVNANEVRSLKEIFEKRKVTSVSKTLEIKLCPAILRAVLFSQISASHFLYDN